MKNPLMNINMKRILFLMLLAVILSPVFSQNDEEKTRSGGNDEMKTLMGKGRSVGGYGSLSIAYTQIQDRDAFVFGAKGGLLMGHIFTIGLGGSGFFNDVQSDEATGKDLSLAGGYLGVFFEPVIMPKFPVHVSFPVMIGAGGVWVMSVTEEEGDWTDNYTSEASDAYMVIEPGVEIELNVTRYFRFCVGGYYRYTTDVDIQDPDISVPVDILHGFSGGVTFKFGRL